MFSTSHQSWSRFHASQPCTRHHRHGCHRLSRDGAVPLQQPVHTTDRSGMLSCNQVVTDSSSQGQHCHSTPSLTVIDRHCLGIYTVILLSLLSFRSKRQCRPGIVTAGVELVARTRGETAGQPAPSAARSRPAAPWPTAAPEPGRAPSPAACNTPARRLRSQRASERRLCLRSRFGPPRMLSGPRRHIPMGIYRRKYFW